MLATPLEAGPTEGLLPFHSIKMMKVWWSCFLVQGWSVSKLAHKAFMHAAGQYPVTIRHKE
jgi:hypothetical protein